MKVVLFCGGLGMRLRDSQENLPKPMMPIGYRPILWHVMKYYAHLVYWHFILCLGYRRDGVKHYFRTYDECVSNDFVLSEGGKKLELLESDISDWRITFVDTGINSSIGERLKAVERHVAGEEEFLANYSDGLTDLPLAAQLEHFRRHGAIAGFVSVKPDISYHFVTARNGGTVTNLVDIGCGGTVLRLAEATPPPEFDWIVFSGDGPRADEARCGASLFLRSAGPARVVVKNFRDGFFPYVGGSIKEYFEELKRPPAPDVIFTHYRGDRHQDHRLISELTWNTFRDQLILEYEVPKYDGDLGTPNCYVPLDGSHRRDRPQVRGAGPTGAV